VYRFVTVMAIILFLTDVAPAFASSQSWCEGSFIAELIFVAFTEYLGNGLVIFRLFVLWNRSRLVMTFLTIGFVLAQASFTACLIFLAKDFRSLVIHQHFATYDICATVSRPLAAILACIPGLAFDVYAGTLLYVNVLDRPRNVDERVIPLLYTDGIVFILLHIAMRLFGLIFMAAAPDVLFVYAFPVTYSLAVTINSRMFLNTQDLERRTRRPPVLLWHPGFKDFVTVEVEREAYELRA